MKTVMMAADALLARPAEVIVAGGMESMSEAPTSCRRCARARRSAPR